MVEQEPKAENLDLFEAAPDQEEQKNAPDQMPPQHRRANSAKLQEKDEVSGSDNDQSEGSSYDSEEEYDSEGDDTINSPKNQESRRSMQIWPDGILCVYPTIL